MSEVHEITKDNSVVYYCDRCRQECFLTDMKDRATALCQIRQCSFCGNKKLVNVYTTDSTFIVLDENGVAMETYVEREGV